MLTSLYLHIPFCNQICTYCDFHKEIANDSKKRNYINALCIEIEHHKHEYTSLSTIYIGGGTPSSLDSELLEQLLQTIKENIDLKNIKEYAIETNPNDLTLDFSRLIHSYGINRVSVGVQTFNESHLTFLGRTHKLEDIYNGINNLKQAGIKNISIDMMFSLVNQTLADLKRDIDLALALDVNHISYYSLILEEKTKLYYLYEHDKVKMNDESLEADMYQMVIDNLTDNGYLQYEISNFSKPGFESIHNLSYWTNKDYLGLGSGAHSLVANKRFYHINNVKIYIENMKNQKFDNYDYYSYDTIMDEMILGLRLTRGISIQYIEDKYELDLLKTYPQLNDFIDSKHLEIIEGNIRLTQTGIFIGNEIFMIFMEVI